MSGRRVGQWRETTLGEVAEFMSGGTPSKDNAEYWTGSIPWVSAKDMKQFRLDDSIDHVSEEAVSGATKLVPANTVFLLTRGMTLLNDVPICVIKRPMTFNQDIKALLPRDGMVEDFLPYLLLGHKETLLNQVDLAGHGTGRLNTDGLKSLEVLLPPEDQQRMIAAIFSKLDDKIELNRKMNETLEAMARALFKSWFVDFDPVRAKAEGRDTGLPAHIAALFPDSFEDSEVGEIPSGWQVCPLSELTSVITKGTTPTQSQMNGDQSSRKPINYIRVNCIGENGTIIVDNLTSIPESVHLGVLKRSILCEDDVLYTIAGSIGRVAVVQDWVLPANTNQAVAIIRPKGNVPWGFLVLSLKQRKFREQLHANIVHAVQANLSLGMLSKAQCISPPAPQLKQIFAPIAHLLTRINNNYIQARSLVALRDALLPKLISGDLRVNNAARLVEVNT